MSAQRPFRPRVTTSSQGLSPALVQIVPFSSLQFATYRWLKSVFAFDPSSGAPSSGFAGSSAPFTHDRAEPSKALPVALGTVSGITAKVAVFPLETVKRRLQVRVLAQTFATLV